MTRILVGGGSAQAILEVPCVPKVGDRITVKEHQIIAACTDNAYLMVGSTFIITSERTTNVEGKKIPWFGLRNIKD